MSSLSCALTVAVSERRKIVCIANFMLSVYGRHPGLRHQTGTGQAWMHAIDRPIRPRSRSLRLVIDLLVRDKDGAEAFGDLLCRCPVLIKSGIPFIIHRLYTDDRIGFSDDQTHVG